MFNVNAVNIFELCDFYRSHLQELLIDGKLFGGTILIGIGLGGILVPSIAVAVSEAAGWNAAFAVLAIGALVGTVISLALPKFSISED